MKRSIRLLAVVGAALFAGSAYADATVYNRANLTGPSLTLRGDSPSLEGTGFYDSISSIDVRGGRWEFCSQPNYRGDCEVLAPGKYAILPKRLNHRIESARPLDRVAYGEPYYEPYYEERRYAQAPEVRPGPAYGAIELYAAPGFRGPSTRLNRDMWSLERRGFDERASSLIVNEGEWELCTDRGWEGFCRVFGPGQYPQLGRRMNDQVSSLRRIG